jgi:ribosomal protein S27AE
MDNTCPPEKWKEEEAKVIKEMSKYDISASSFSWINSTCPDCGAANWVEMSVEMDACQCFRCKKTFWISKSIYENYKTSLVMSKVFDYEAKVPEWVFKGLEKPDF